MRDAQEPMDGPAPDSEVSVSDPWWHKTPPSWAPFLAVFLPQVAAIVILGVELSPDAQWTWDIAVGDTEWSNHHPWPYTALAWLVTRVSASEFLLALVQAGIIALAFARLCRVMSVRLSQGVWPLVGASVMAMGVASYRATELVKDSVFLATAAWLTAALIVWLTMESAECDRWQPRLELAIAAAATSLFRWPGVVTVLLAVAAAALVAPRGRRARMLAVGSLAGIAGFGLVWIAPSVAPIRPIASEMASASQLADLAFAVSASDHSPLDPGQIAVLERVAPIEAWEEAGAAACETVDEVTYGVVAADGGTERLQANIDELTGVWSDLVRADPSLPVTVRLCRSSRLIGFVYTQDDSYPLLSRLLPRVRGASAGLSWFSAALSPLIPLTLAFLFTGLASARRWRLALGVVSVPVAIVLTFLVNPYSNVTRYFEQATQISITLAVGAGGALFVALWDSRVHKDRSGVSHEQPPRS